MTTSDTAFIELLRKAPRRFSELLDQLCTAAGLSQARLSREAKQIRKHFIEEGLIAPRDPLIGSMEQPTISSVISGAQAPTYGQVWIWLKAIRTWYESPRLVEKCKQIESEYHIEMPVPQFDHKLEMDLWRLALFGTPDEIINAYNRTKNLNLLDENLPSLQDPRSLRLRNPIPNRSPRAEPNTNVDLQTFPTTDQLPVQHVPKKETRQYIRVL
jgi:hypothetical protein